MGDQVLFAATREDHSSQTVEERLTSRKVLAGYRSRVTSAQSSRRHTTVGEAQIGQRLDTCRTHVLPDTGDGFSRSLIKDQGAPLIGRKSLVPALEPPTDFEFADTCGSEGDQIMSAFVGECPRFGRKIALENPKIGISIFE